MKKKANWIGHDLDRNCLLNTLSKKIQREGEMLREDEKEYISSYWMAIGQLVDTGS
jgi:hypothetical protein